VFMPESFSNSTDQPPHLTGVRNLVEDYGYTTFFLDLFGLLHNGVSTYPGTIDCLQSLRNANRTICLISNTPKPSRESRHDLADKGITEDLYDHFVTAGDTAYKALSARDDAFHRQCRGKVWFIGTQPFQTLLDGLDVTQVEGPEDADFILNVIPGTGPTNRDFMRRQFETAITRDLPMVCANPDRVVHIGESLHECAGTYAAIYEAMGGRVAWHGKPFSAIYARARELCGTDKGDICALGDSLQTDIAGANGFGIAGVLNLRGIHWEEFALDHAPERADMDKVRSVITEQGHKPLALINGFAW
jgi:HAD superfamily hydrolase (TIGR01459 family)